MDLIDENGIRDRNDWLEMAGFLRVADNDPKRFKYLYEEITLSEAYELYYLTAINNFRPIYPEDNTPKLF